MVRGDVQGNRHAIGLNVDAPASALARGVKHGGGQVSSAGSLQLDGSAQGIGHDLAEIGHDAVGENAAAQGNGLRGCNVNRASLGGYGRHVKQTSGGLGEGVSLYVDAANFCRQVAAGREKTCR